MQKWEYHRLFLDPNESEFMNKLSSVGERGWELVGIITLTNRTNVWLLLKRLLITKPDTDGRTISENVKAGEDEIPNTTIGEGE